MRSIMSKWGKHIAAIAVFLVLTVIYFSPAVFEGKVVRQGDTEKAIGMGNSQMDEYEKTAQPGEFSAWSILFAAPTIASETSTLEIAAVNFLRSRV